MTRWIPAGTLTLLAVGLAGANAARAQAQPADTQTLWQFEAGG